MSHNIDKLFCKSKWWVKTLWFINSIMNSKEVVETNGTSRLELKKKNIIKKVWLLTTDKDLHIIYIVNPVMALSIEQEHTCTLMLELKHGVYFL